MKPIVIALLCVCALAGEMAATSSNSLAWRAFKRLHAKAYQGPEEAMRLANFLRNKELVDRHNSNPEAGFRMELNHMADWSAEEYQRLNGFRLSDKQKLSKFSAPSARLAELLDGPVPDELDWREVPNRVTAVKDQGSCASCWAFSTTGLLEGQEVEHNFTKKIVDLSEQELIDCSHHNHGCGGGDMVRALEDITNDLKGIESEQDYPYAGTDNTCQLKKGKAVMTVKSIFILKPGNEVGLKQAVALYGPVAVGIDATNKLMHYSSGVFSDSTCLPNGINHAVLLVGYGRDAKEGDYWIVKNSWGTGWGEKGYFKLQRGTDMCGISQYALIAEF